MSGLGARRRCPIVALAASLLVACASPTRVRGPADASPKGDAATAAVMSREPDPDRYSDSEFHFSVRIPNRWRRAKHPLTGLANPVEILSAGTYHLRAGGPNCKQFPVNAIVDLGFRDALVTVQERVDIPPNDAGNLSAHFFRRKANRRNANDESPACLDDRKTFSHWFINFRESGRQFYAYVAFGPKIRTRTERSTWHLLGSLLFDRPKEE